MRRTNVGVVARWCLIASLISLTACAHPGSLVQGTPPVALQWPAKPDIARIQWVKTVADYQDAGIAKGFWKKVLEFVAGADESHIVRPHGVLLDGQERLCIADPGAGVVHVMDVKEGRYTIIGRESGSPLRTPIGVAEDAQDRLYITDSTAGKVFRYDFASRTLSPFLQRSLLRPTGIAYNKSNKLLYVVDTAASQIVALDEKGGEKLRFGTVGENGGGFNRPTDIAVDAAGQIYVTDPLNYRIKRFTPDGKLLTQFGAPGDGVGYLNKPKGVAVDSEGHIYVSDALLDAVQIFDETGRLLLVFGSNGTGNGEFWMPSGIYIDQHDNIFVADTYNRRIQVFRYIPEAGPVEGAGSGGVQDPKR
jgi:DNA-binding beta-propeller fold protein YncE